jgi:hypothetical protein
MKKITQEEFLQKTNLTKEEKIAKRKAYLKAYWKVYRKVYRKANKEKITKRSKAYYEKNKDKLAKKSKEYYNKNKDRLAENQKKRNTKPEVKARFNEWQRKRRSKNPKIRIHDSVSCQIRNALNKGGKNGERTFEILGYTVEELMSHLESKFKPWMNWSNFGKHDPNKPPVWNIDHIIPVSHFKFQNYNDPEFKKCWSLDNLQPLSGKENLSKGSKLII